MFALRAWGASGPFRRRPWRSRGAKDPFRIAGKWQRRIRCFTFGAVNPGRCTAATAILLLVACVYPRRTTSLMPVSGPVQSDTAPADVWSLTVVGAQIPPRSRGNLAWDDHEGLPDPFVRIYRNDALVWESPTLHDTLAPTWNAELPRNFYAPAGDRLRFEIWDRDEVGADPVGIFRHLGLPPNVVTDADARILLEGGAQLSLRLGPPRAHRGVGIRLYEVRGDELVVLEVETYSPAGRAGIVPGDRIIAIGGEAVSALGPQRASSALSMAAERRSPLRVKNDRGDVREVQLDLGYTWLVM